MSKTIAVLLIAACLFSVGSATAQISDSSSTTQVYLLDIKEEIAPPVWHHTKNAFTKAIEMDADLMLIHMNTYGGMLESADSIRTKILNAPMPVYVFIDNNAASAGALISIACDSIYMRKGASIGAATVVNQTGEQLPDKYQSYMRSMMRATAEATGRDPDIAQAMVDDRIRIQGITDSGQVITFTTSEAIENGFCEGEAETIEEVLELAGIEDYKITKHELTAVDRIIGFLISPVISGLLIMVIVGGIYFELQSPGIGFPLGAAILAAMLYFAPLYVEGLAANWEIVIFIIGLALIAVEIFALPGFGIAGVSGIILVVAGLTLSMVDNVGDQPLNIDLNALVRALFVVIIAFTASIILSIYLSQRLFTTTTFGQLALATTQPKDQGFTSARKEYTEMLGKTGSAYSDLRPSGKVEINGEIFDATALTGFIEMGQAVKVVKYQNAQLFVLKA